MMLLLLALVPVACLENNNIVPLALNRPVPELALPADTDALNDIVVAL